MDHVQARLVIVAYLEGAFRLAEQLGDGALSYLIERALDEAQSQAFSSVPAPEAKH